MRETLEDLIKKYELYLCQEKVGLASGCFFCAESHDTPHCPNQRAQAEYWDLIPPLKGEEDVED